MSGQPEQVALVAASKHRVRTGVAKKNLSSICVAATCTMPRLGLQLSSGNDLVPQLVLVFTLKHTNWPLESQL